VPHLRGADAVILLAWLRQPSRDLNKLWMNNVEGSNSRRQEGWGPGAPVRIVDRHVLAGTRDFVFLGTNAHSICVPGGDVNNDKDVRRVYEDLPRYGEVKPDLLQQRYGAYDPRPVVYSRICLASSTNKAGTSTSLGPADRKSGASKPAARWISDGMPASFSTPSISSATDSSGAAATFTHLSSMRGFYPNGSMLGVQWEER
jgi:hypothetical protein